MFIGRCSFLRPPLTNGHDYVNENSQSQDYSDELTEAPGVFAGLDDRAIARDLVSA
jgi:hypothetical protein